MKTFRFFFLPALLSLACAYVGASESLSANLEVECTGRPGAQVAMRWAHPDYSGPDAYMPLFTVPCGVGRRSTSLLLLHRNSEFEIQTEGGIQTSYAVEATLGDGSNIRLDHTGSPDVITRGSGFSLIRSSGPNRYGEQNFRVVVPEGKVAAVRVVATSTGDRGDAQMALRWGHADFNEHEYFQLWKVKPSGPQELTFHLADSKSEFEIQTEGGEGTGYHLAVWLDFGDGVGMQPSIDISHRLSGTSIGSGTNNGDTFAPTKGNAYGEINVRATVPELPVLVTPPGNWSTVGFMRRPGPANGGPIPYVGQLGLGSGGHFTAIQSAEPFDVELVGGGGATTDDCGKANGRTVLLRKGQRLSDKDFESAFGHNPIYPTPFAGCAYSDVPAFNIQVFTVSNPR
jgi:hypothetical protein